MPSPRFYCPNLPHPRLSEGLCALDADETRHARKVLRLSEGQRVELFDGAGQLATADLVAYREGAAVCRVLSVESVDPPSPKLTIACAVPKGPRAEDMVNQLAQLGADRFVPLRCERGIVDPGDGKLERFAKASLTAAKQSGRLHFMKVLAPAMLAEVLDEVCDIGLILDPRGEPLNDLPDRLTVSKHTMLLIGPEGGWTPSELDAAERAGYDRWKLGPNVLRIETAATTAVGVLRYLAG